MSKTNVVKIDADQPRKERAQHAEMDKHLDKTAQYGDKAASSAKEAISSAQNVIRDQLEHRNADSAEAKDEVRDKALADGVKAVESLDAAMRSIKSMRGDVLTRLNATFDLTRKDMNQVIKERNFPKEQYELELNLNRNVINAYHGTLERLGVARVEREATNNGKSKKAA